VCRRCSLISLCASCAGAAELEHGDPEAIVAHSCEVTHRRAHAFASGASGHREDASCCLGAAVAAAAKVPSTPSPAPAGACGGGTGGACGCASSGREAAAPLIQIGRRPA
jgi:hypothetical protein